MSAGVALSRQEGVELARRLREGMRVDATADEVVKINATYAAGSVRRMCDVIHDLDLVAMLPSMPARPKVSDDALYRALWRICDAEHEPVGLFDQRRTKSEVMLKVVQGFAPGFLCAQFICVHTNIKVQINRAPLPALGWLAIRCTGPREFGIEFLVRWKKRYGISGDRASIQGHLVNASGEKVPVESEQQAFAACGMEFVKPEHREAWVAREAKRQKVDRDWRLR